MTVQSVFDRPFVIDAETLEYLLEDLSSSTIASAIHAAILSKEVLIPFSTMLQLKENCPSLYAKLENAELKGVRRQDLIEPTRTMLQEVEDSGYSVSAPLKSKIYVLALAKNRGCCVLTVDCRPTNNSTSSLATVFGVKVMCVGR